MILLSSTLILLASTVLAEAFPGIDKSGRDEERKDALIPTDVPYGDFRLQETAASNKYVVVICETSQFTSCMLSARADSELLGTVFTISQGKDASKVYLRPKVGNSLQYVSAPITGKTELRLQSNVASADFIGNLSENAWMFHRSNKYVQIDSVQRQLHVGSTNNVAKFTFTRALPQNLNPSFSGYWKSVSNNNYVGIVALDNSLRVGGTAAGHWVFTQTDDGNAYTIAESSTKKIVRLDTNLGLVLDVPTASAERFIISRDEYDYILAFELSALPLMVSIQRALVASDKHAIDYSTRWTIMVD